MRFIGTAIEKLQRHPKRIVFPEGTEPRVLQAARQFYSLRLGAPILLGNRTKIKNISAELNISLEGIRIINPSESEDFENFAKRFETMRRAKGLKLEEARQAMLNPNYFGAMMVAMHQADGIVSGVKEFGAAVLRPFFQIITPAPGIKTVTSCMIMEVQDSRYGEQGVFFLADCDVVPQPTVEQIANTAVLTAQLAHKLLGQKPRVALLSFSTKGSSTHPEALKMQAATALASQIAFEKKIEAEFDGELQADVAIVPEVAKRELQNNLNNPVAGKANVLIFPDLNSGSISSRLIQHISKANAYGQILLGLNEPAADVAHGADAHEVLGVAAIVGVQAIEYKYLFPEAGKKLPGENSISESF
ncbi:MAG TPA: phosphate acyltransferase [Verrucomicrobiota bacterium]|nr:phosphate acyltransferase [Verrucomicrobiota bacterium]